MNKHKRYLTMEVLVFTAIMSTRAGAQEDSPERGGTLQEVIVTADKRSEKAEDVPVSISVVSGADLQVSGVNAVEHLPEVTPGLTINNLAGFAQIYIRGIGSDYGQIGVNQSVATYVDGVVLQNSGGVNQSLMDVTRVEVLKGPQGTLYGRNATGGAINVITRTPTDTPELEASISDGNYDDRLVSAYVAGPIAGGLKASVAASFDRHESYTTNIGGPYLGDAIEGAVRAKFLYSAENGIDTTISLFYVRNNYGGNIVFAQRQSNSVGAAFGGTTAPDAFHVVSNNFVEDSRYTQRGSSLTVRVPFDHVDLVSISGFTSFNSPTVADYDATSAPVAFFISDQIDKTTSEELQLISKNDSSFQWVTGLYYLHNHAGYQPLTTPTATGGLTSLTSISTSDSYAGYAQGRYSLSDQAALTVGARYSNDETTYDGYSVDGSPTVGRRSAQWNNFSPQITLDWKHDDVLWYGTLTSGYKAGSFNLSNPGDTAPVEPERVVGLELGSKAPLATWARVEAAAFAYDYKHLQISIVPSNTDPTELENANEAKIAGLELDAVVAPIRSLNLRAGATWLAKAKYTDYHNGSGYVDNTTAQPAFPYGNTVETFNFTGNRMAHAPKLSANIGGDYTWTLPYGEVSAGANMFYTESYWFTAQDADFARQPSYTLVNMDLSYATRGGHWRVTAAGQNLGNRDYYGSILPNTLGVVGTFPSPRTYSLKFSYKF